MMESVGPVDCGDKRALPDFSPAEQGQRANESLQFRVNQRLSPLSPACRKVSEAVHNSPVHGLVLGMKRRALLVRSFVPWFMPVVVHNPPEPHVNAAPPPPPAVGFYRRNA